MSNHSFMKFCTPTLEILVFLTLKNQSLTIKMK